MKWFKHDTDANMDAKLQEVMLDYGLEGYGLYWYCIELIAQRVSGNNLTFELEHDCRIIARNTGSTPQKVEQMMKSFIDLGLLNSDNGHVFCLKLASRCDDFTAKAVRRNGIKTLTNQPVGVSLTNSDFIPLEEEVRSKKKKKEIDLDFTKWTQTPSKEILKDFLAMRKRKKHSVSQYFVNNSAKQIATAITSGWSVDDCLSYWLANEYQGFKAEWMGLPHNIDNNGNFTPRGFNQ